MAKKGTNGVNKSQSIRDYLESHPGATPKQIKSALSDQGIEVSEGLVSVVKYGGKKKAAQGGRGAVRQRAAAKSVPAGGRGGPLSGEDLLETKRLVDHLGGIAATRRALDVLEQLA